MEFIGDLERAIGAAIYPNRVPIAIGLMVALVAVAIVAAAVRSVVIWCKQFSVQFAHAPLAAG